MKKLSLVFSYLLHPIFLPALFMVFLLLTPYYMNDMLKPGAFRVLMLTLLVFTFFIPVFILTIARMTGIIDTFMLEKRSERIFALLITALATYFAWRMFGSFDLPAYYSMFLIVFVLVLLLTSVINLFYKISLHMVGWGAVTALMILYFLIFDLGISLMLIPVFLISGIAAWARLEQDAHTPAQVYAGFGVGLLALISYYF
ncbi:MAG: hypothetical protein C0592_09365 [Marinilabiliales bacterium]|nr:MAG: hypothetical protein C0592_09365 [Marinilabiliales bacterium]